MAWFTCFTPSSVALLWWTSKFKSCENPWKTLLTASESASQHLQLWHQSTSNLVSLDWCTTVCVCVNSLVHQHTEAARLNGFQLSASQTRTKWLLFDDIRCTRTFNTGDSVFQQLLLTALLCDCYYKDKCLDSEMTIAHYCNCFHLGVFVLFVQGRATVCDASFCSL